MILSESRVGFPGYTFLLATALLTFAGFATWTFLSYRGQSVPKGLRRPPSPPGARLFSGHSHLWSGNATSNPSQSQLVKWSQEYGEIYEIRLGVERWVVLSSPEAVKEVFDKNGAVTSSRPRMRVAMDVLSGGYRMLFMPYGKQWRAIRAIAHRCLSTKGADLMKPSQSLESRQYLQDILKDPGNFLDHVKRYTSSVIMYSIFGRRIPNLDDPVLKAIYQETSVFGEVVGQRFLVDQYPVLAKLPHALQWWRRKYAPAHQFEVNLWMGLWNDLKKRLDAGVRTGCFGEKFMEEDYPAMGVSELQAAYVAGSMIEAGSDTTQLSMNSLILGLVAFPDVVPKAHQELDAVVGDRLPQFEDIKNLPYIRAMVKEVLRWRSVSNDHIRHDTTGDVVYKDYFIPAGSTVVLNQWAIHYNPLLYPDPQRYNPDRYMDHPAIKLTAGECIHTSDLRLRDHWSFGVGRRVCAGYNLAENSLLILTARLLWAFDVRPAIDANTRKEMKYDLWNYAPIRLFGPRAFPVSFQVRGEEKRAMIMNPATS